MTETTEAPATGTPALNAALAAAQAEMPPIAKGETGKVSGVDKYGKPFSYTYSYADLGGLAAVAYPVFGKHGLSFSAQPTLTGDGKFVLRYQLRHESGEFLDGVMPLPSAGKPQELGSVLTYYRRYAFCAVTGIHPGGDDDDAQSANNPQQYDRPASAAEAFESAAPQVADEAVVADWSAKIDEITTPDDAARVDAELKEVFRAGHMDPTTANTIRAAIKTRHVEVTKPREPVTAAANGQATP